MKKKLFLVIFSLLLLLGCRQPETESAETDTPTEEQPTFAFTQDMVSPYAAQTGETSFPVTINTRTRKDEGWEYTYRNQTIDCADLRMEVLSFDPYSETEAMKLRVALPGDWDETLCKWASREGLHLRFEVDGKPVDAFRERVITVQNKNEFEVLYRKCILDEYALSGKLFSVRPYFSEWEGVYASHQLHSLENGEAVSFAAMQTDYIADRAVSPMAHSFIRHYPDNCAVSIRMHEEDDTLLPAPQILRPVTVEYPEYEKYLDILENANGEYIFYGRVSVRETDFSKAAFVLDEFHIWEDEVKIAFTFKMPDDWDIGTCAYFSHCLNFYAYVGDPAQDHKSMVMNDSPFGTRSFVATRHTNAYWPPLAEPKEHVLEINFIRLEFVFTREQWDAAEQLTITPWYSYYTDIYYDAERDNNGVALNTIPIPAEGLQIDQSFGYNVKYMWLDELAIHIPITEDLFDSGF